MPTARRKARKRALDVLFEADQRGLEILDVLAIREAANDPPVAAYAAELARGVAAHREEIDARIAGALSDDWTLARLPSVDRSVLRIGVYELAFRDDVPAGVAISEAVGLTAELSTDASPDYVNGVLASIAATTDVAPA